MTVYIIQYTLPIKSSLCCLPALPGVEHHAFLHRCAVYFTTLFNLAKKIPAEPSPVSDKALGVQEEGKQSVKVELLSNSLDLTMCTRISAACQFSVNP